MTTLPVAGAWPAAPPLSASRLSARNAGCFANFCPPTPPIFQGGHHANDPFALPADHSLESHSPIRPVRATGMLIAGLLSGMAAGSAITGLARPKAMAQAATAAAAAAKDARPGELKNFLYYNQPLYALVHMASLYDQYHRPLLAYLGASILGYLGGTLAQGTQETIVRQQETLIRARLISQLKTAFQDSLGIKQRMDDGLRGEAVARLQRMLRSAGVRPDPAWFAGAGLAPPIPGLESDRQYQYGPISRQLPLTFAGRPDPTDEAASAPTDETAVVRGLEAATFGVGFTLGSMAHGMMKVLHRHSSKIPVIEKFEHGTFLNNAESAFVSRNKLLLAGVFLITGAARLGKLLVDALREIEVTRLNAETERRYQEHNWRVLDPSFHALAERQALEADLSRFETDLPLLSQRPDLIGPRIQQILANRGRSSPPPFYPATPAVMLTEAKG